MRVLGIETSCDETGAALAEGGAVRANALLSQVKLHSEYGGVVPELASREHLRNLLPLARAAFAEAGWTPEAVEAVAATRGPGLPGALIVGWRFAQAFAFARGIPCLGIHHHEAHLYSAWIEGSPPRAAWEAFEPNVSLIVSGGHTLLVDVPALFRHKLLGRTLDDAAGECFDKTAKLLGLPYPGGPAMDRLAEEGDPDAFDFPRPMLNDPGDDFSFSGLKTSVRYFLRDHRELLEEEARVRDLCASIRQAIVDVLAAKTLRAARRLRRGCVTISGGVACNRLLRRTLVEACAREGIRFRAAQPAFCTDNAAMIALVGEKLLESGRAPTPWAADSEPGWRLS